MILSNSFFFGWLVTTILALLIECRFNFRRSLESTFPPQWVSAGSFLKQSLVSYDHRVSCTRYFVVLLRGLCWGTRSRGNMPGGILR